MNGVDTYPGTPKKNVGCASLNVSPSEPCNWNHFIDFNLKQKPG